MPFKRTPIRYAHSNGYTYCIYSQDGEKIISCGSDGDIRTWVNIHDDDPSSQCIGELTICLDQYDKRMLVSTELNTVQAFTYPEADRENTEFRFTATVTCIKSNEKYLAAGSEDTEIQVVPKDKSADVIVLKGHSGPVLAIDLSPKNLLASSSGDGTIKIWDLQDKKEIKSLSGFELIKSFEGATVFCSPSFNKKTGLYMAYPKTKSIIIAETTNWSTKYTLKDDKISGNYSVCSYSPCGNYLAAGTTKGEISIWEIKKNGPSLIKGETKNSENYGITSMAWNPDNTGELAYCDSTGQLGTVIDSYGTNLTGVSIIEEAEEAEGEEDDFYANVNFVGDDEDADNENCVDLKKLKEETLRSESNILDMDDDMDSIKGDKAEIGGMISMPMTSNLFPIQPPFQSSATPQNLEHRYLCWNQVGIVRCHNTAAENSIEVEFHDASTHHGIHMDNYLHHTMASLSSTVVALAGETSKLVCIELGASGSKQWSTDLPDCEEILAVATSDKLVAVATDARYLRIFTVLGTQREVLSLPGPVVAVAGRSDKIIVAFHDGPATKDQNISMMLLQTIGYTLRSRTVKVPLTPASKLSWIGYSDRGSPVAFDSRGMIRLYNFESNQWFPICDTSKHTKGVSDNYYIIEISESTQLIRAVLCRGSSYPLTTPRPLVSQIKFQVPLCELDSEKSQIEESIVRWANFKVIDSEKNLKTDAIKLFALACRNEMETRARELVEMIASPQVLELAARYANKLGRIHLSERLNSLIPEIEEQERVNEKKKRTQENLLEVTMYSNSILLSQQKEKESQKTPIIAPKGIERKVNSNPFKKNLQNSTKPNSTTKSNPLSHLTEKAIGFKETDSQNISGVSQMDMFEEDTENDKPMQNSENMNKSAKKSLSKFASWFKENKVQLELECSGADDVDLGKYALDKFKSLDESPKSATGKRKLDTPEEKKKSSVSKLAKFGFTPN